MFVTPIRYQPEPFASQPDPSSARRLLLIPLLLLAPLVGGIWALATPDRVAGIAAAPPVGLAGD